MKQTAVEWLIHILKGQQDKTFNIEEWMNAIEHAKAMEKEQITQSFIGGADFREMNKRHNRSAASYADQYYNTNFKTKISW